MKVADSSTNKNLLNKVDDKKEKLNRLSDGKINLSDSDNRDSEDKIKLSTRAQDIQQIKKLVSSKDKVDEEKVARLQKLIDAGEYNVNSEAVAEKLLNEHIKMT